MAEEEKKVTAEEAKEEAAEPKVVYSYRVMRYDNGLYDFEGDVLEGQTVPCIDKYHIARDMIEAGRKLDHQLTVEEAKTMAKQEIYAELNQMAQQQAAATTDDPTKA